MENKTIQKKLDFLLKISFSSNDGSLKKKFNKIAKPLARQIKKKHEIQLLKLRTKEGIILPTLQK